MIQAKDLALNQAHQDIREPDVTDQQTELDQERDMPPIPTALALTTNVFFIHSFFPIFN